jgi:hypothetical protein
VLADRGGHHHPIPRHPLQGASEGARAPPVAPQHGRAPAMGHAGHRDQVHVEPDGNRRVAAGQAARGDEQVVDRLHPQSAELARHGGGQVAGRPEGPDVLERIARLAVVVGGSPGEVRGQPLGQRDEVAAGVGAGPELESHRSSSHGRVSGTGSSSRAAAASRAA